MNQEMIPWCKDPSKRETMSSPTEESMCNISVNNNSETSETNTNCNNKDKKRYYMKYPRGTKIIKRWNGVPYKGTIQSYDREFYKIRYTGGDEEELSQYKVCIYQKNNQPRTRKRKFYKGVRYWQTTMSGKILDVEDSKVFGRNFPKQITEFSTLVTFQNLGKQDESGDTMNSKAVAYAFRNSKAGVAL